MILKTVPRQTSVLLTYGIGIFVSFIWHFAAHADPHHGYLDVPEIVVSLQTSLFWPLDVLGHLMVLS